MNVLIFTRSHYVRDTFINALIPTGVSVYHSDKLEDMVEKISTTKMDLLVFDVIEEGDYEPTFKVMAVMKHNPDEKFYRVGILLIIGSVDKNMIVKALQLGALGFIKSNASQNTIAKYVVDIYQKVKGVSPERKFVRVSLDTKKEADQISIKFRSAENMQMLMGVVKDISSGGIAVELVGTFEHLAIKVGMEVENMQFILDNKNVMVNATVVAYQKRFCAMRFTDVLQQDREIISQFIFDRIK